MKIIPLRQGEDKGRESIILPLCVSVFAEVGYEYDIVITLLCGRVIEIEIEIGRKKCAFCDVRAWGGVL